MGAIEILSVDEVCGSFFSPASSGMVDTLIGQYKQARNRIKEVAEFSDQRAGIPATEHVPHQIFWASSNKVVSLPTFDFSLPCECTEAA